MWASIPQTRRAIGTQWRERETHNSERPIEPVEWRESRIEEMNRDWIMLLPLFRPSSSFLMRIHQSMLSSLFSFSFLLSRVPIPFEYFIFCLDFCAPLIIYQIIQLTTNGPMSQDFNQKPTRSPLLPNEILFSSLFYKFYLFSVILQCIDSRRSGRLKRARNGAVGGGGFFPLRFYLCMQKAIIDHVQLSWLGLERTLSSTEKFKQDRDCFMFSFNSSSSSSPFFLDTVPNKGEKRRSKTQLGIEKKKRFINISARAKFKSKKLTTSVQPDREAS